MLLESCFWRREQRLQRVEDMRMERLPTATKRCFTQHAPPAGKSLSQESRIQQLELFFFPPLSSFKSYIIVLTNNNGPVTAPTILKGSKIRFGICNYEC